MVPLGIEMAGKRDDGILANLKDFIISPNDKRNVTKEASSDTFFRLWQVWQLDALASLEVQQLCVGKTSSITSPRNDDLGTYQAKSSMLLLQGQDVAKNINSLVMGLRVLLYT